MNTGGGGQNIHSSPAQDDDGHTITQGRYQRQQNTAKATPLSSVLWDIDIIRNR